MLVSLMRPDRPASHHRNQRQLAGSSFFRDNESNSNKIYDVKVTFDRRCIERIAIIQASSYIEKLTFWIYDEQILWLLKSEIYRLKRE